MARNRHDSDRDREERGFLAYVVGGVIAALGLLQALRGDRQPSLSDQPESSDADADPAFAESVERGYEVRDWDIRVIIAFGVVMLVAAIVIHVGIWWLLEGFAGRSLPLNLQIPPALITPREAPGPGVAPVPREELEAVREAELDVLTTYGWVDRDEGVVRIPIDRAMELLVERGVPARDAEVPEFGLDSAYELDSEGGQEFGGIRIVPDEEDEQEEP